MLKKKISASFQRIIELFTQKFVTKLSKYGFGIRDPEIHIFRIPDPDPGVKKAPDPGHWIRNTAKNSRNKGFSYCFSLMMEGYQL
jgi:hypothetical protein